MSGISLLICHLNIAKFKALLDTPVDDAQRQMITALLAEEQSRELVERAAQGVDRSRWPGPPV